MAVRVGLQLCSLQFPKSGSMEVLCAEALSRQGLLQQPLPILFLGRLFDLMGNVLYGNGDVGFISKMGENPVSAGRGQWGIFILTLKSGSGADFGRATGGPSPILLPAYWLHSQDTCHFCHCRRAVSTFNPASTQFWLWCREAQTDFLMSSLAVLALVPALHQDVPGRRGFDGLAQPTWSPSLWEEEGPSYPPEEKVDVLIRRQKVEKHHPPTGDGQCEVQRNTSQCVNRLEVLQRANRTLKGFFPLVSLERELLFPQETLIVGHRQPLLLSPKSPPRSTPSSLPCKRALCHCSVVTMALNRHIKLKTFGLTHQNGFLYSTPLREDCKQLFIHFIDLLFLLKRKKKNKTKHPGQQRKCTQLSREWRCWAMMF